MPPLIGEIGAGCRQSRRNPGREVADARMYIPARAEWRSDGLYELQRSRKAISTQRHRPASCGRRPAKFNRSALLLNGRHANIPADIAIDFGVVIPPPNNSGPRRTDTPTAAARIRREWAPREAKRPCGSGKKRSHRPVNQTGGNSHSQSWCDSAVCLGSCVNRIDQNRQDH